MGQLQQPGIGKVYLVGAGPGDPRLLTLRGRECLATADTVLYDYLVNPRLLEHCRDDATRICLGRHGRTRIWTQPEVNAKLVELALSGQRVVRLKCGDPIVFARGAEEAEALETHGIPVEIVPGVTSALAAAACAGIPLTHREHASAVALVTGHERDGKVEELDFARLAHFPGTLAIYMGVTTAGVWTTALMEGGLPADTPAALVRRVSYCDQQTWCCTLETLAEHIADHKVRPPVIAIIGPAAEQKHALRWFEQRPLFGQRVLVTRPRQQALDLIGKLEEFGAETLLQPTIEIQPPETWEDVDASIAKLVRPGWDWVVFSSANGVAAWMDRLLEHGDVRQLAGAKLAAVGSATAAALRAYRLEADLVPEQYHAEGMSNAILQASLHNSHPARVLLVRASRGRDVLRETLTAAGMEVEQVTAYQSVDVEAADPEVVDALSDGSPTWVTVTSSAIARSLDRLLGDRLGAARLASISPITSATLRELGYEPTVEAEPHTMDGLLDAIVAGSRGAATDVDRERDQQRDRE
ncbi:MAG: uroporphyrinogen-III C-methyltransferase [Planctomycetales bacterium]|nr:uroporphyrinogen-III C-methyltransferase [Planctomycetales bacterium]